MAAASPRCIQQTSFSHPKSIHSSPNSPSTSSPSSQSRLQSLSPHLLWQSRPASSPQSDVLNHIPTIAIPPTHDPLPPHHSILNPSSPVSVSNTSEPHHHLNTNPPHRSWISTLLATKFYGPCTHHPNLRKNDLNLFCTTHAVKICQYCSHASHSHSNSPCTILHVSRYMYHDVLLAKESASLFDVSDVQSYLNNGNRVVYIDRRAQPKSKLAPHAKACQVCSRTLQDPYRFCSVFCRLAHAKDPAAAPSLPVPDAAPLVVQSPRKVKLTPHPPASSQLKKTDRTVKRCDRETANRSVQHLPSSPSPPVGRDSPNFIPHSVNIVSMKKKHRRKTHPLRSPPPVPQRVALFHFF